MTQLVKVLNFGHENFFQRFQLILNLLSFCFVDDSVASDTDLFTNTTRSGKLLRYAHGIAKK